MKTLSEMHSKKIPIEPFTYGRILRMYTDKEKLDGVERTLKEMKMNGITPDTVTYNAVLHSYARKDDSARAEAIFKEMKEMGDIRDARTYMEMVRLYCAREDAKRCKELLNEMYKEGLEPPQEIYLDVIYCLGQNHNYIEAIELYEKAKRHHVKPSAVLLNLMLEIATKIKDPAFMTQLLQEMWEARVEPHPDHYEAIRELH